MQSAKHGMHRCSSTLPATGSNILPADSMHASPLSPPQCANRNCCSLHHCACMAQPRCDNLASFDCKNPCLCSDNNRTSLPNAHQGMTATRYRCRQFPLIQVPPIPFDTRRCRGTAQHFGKQTKKRQQLLSKQWRIATSQHR